MYLTEDFRERLDEKRRKLDSLRPLPVQAVRKLREQFELEMTYNSNAIEGNSLTLKETYLVISEGLTIKGKPLKDHLEAKNHTDAMAYLFELVEQKRKQTISQYLIRSLHHLVVQDTDQGWAGRYRNSAVMITGTDHRPPEAVDVSRCMSDLIAWVGKERSNLHVVELAALFHHKLVHIHPFFDGNGRTARLAMNIFLLQAGFPLVIVLKNDRQKYYRVLAQADKDRYEPLVRFVAQAVERSLDMYIRVLTPSTKKKERFMTLAELSEQSSYSPKYLNLLARSGKLEAHKEGRNWLASKEALERYIRGRKRKR
jgi:Fic family protein